MKTIGHPRDPALAEQQMEFGKRKAAPVRRLRGLYATACEGCHSAWSDRKIRLIHLHRYGSGNAGAGVDLNFHEIYAGVP